MEAALLSNVCAVSLRKIRVLARKHHSVPRRQRSPDPDSGALARALTRGDDLVESKELPSWRWEALRTTLWFVPAVLIVLGALMFLVTFKIDAAAYEHQSSFRLGCVTQFQSGRDVLIASQRRSSPWSAWSFNHDPCAHLGVPTVRPRMMRNFVRDVGNQVTLGVFVGSFTYSVLALGSITFYSTAPSAAPQHHGRRSNAVVGRRGLGLFITHRGDDQLPKSSRASPRPRVVDRYRVPDRRHRRRVDPRRPSGFVHVTRARELLAMIDARVEWLSPPEWLPPIRRVRPTRQDRQTRGCGHSDSIIVRVTSSSRRPVAKVFPRGAAEQVEKLSPGLT